MAIWQRIKNLIAPQHIETAAALGRFLDEQTAFVAQKAMMEHSQARTARLGSALLEEKAFLKAFEDARWPAYAAILPDMALMLDAALRAKGGLATERAMGLMQIATMHACTLYPVPADEPENYWMTLHQSIMKDLARAHLAAPHTEQTMSEQGAQKVYAVLPVKTPGKQDDEFRLFHKVLKLHMARVREEFGERIRFKNA